jgi:uncharacterized protein YukJ
MSIQPYGIIKGTIEEFKLAGRQGQPHLHLLMDAAGAKKDVAVNVISVDQSEVRFAINNRTPANADALAGLPAGVKHCNGNDGFALDYIRTPGLISESEMTLLDVAELQPTSMHEAVIALVQRAISEKATVYAFGQLFGTPGATNPTFGFEGDAGCHDDHMNQGNPKGNHDRDNGTFQDGCILVQWADGTWSGLFIAFQTQSWNTDDQGNAV